MNPEVEKPKENIPLESLNPTFQVSLGGGWLWNTNPSMYPISADRKALFLFNAGDSDLLTQCPSVGKIGRNADPETLKDYDYIGFVYGDELSSEELINFAKIFSKPKLILGLTDTGVSKESSTITDL